MNNILKISAIGLATLFLSTGCAYKASVGASNVNISNVDMTTVDSMKHGKACVQKFLMFPISMDATANTAAKKAGISKIMYQEYSNEIGFFTESHCITVYGK